MLTMRQPATLEQAPAPAKANKAAAAKSARHTAGIARVRSVDRSKSSKGPAIWALYAEGWTIQAVAKRLRPQAAG